jgi:hypothetical protein
MPPPRVSSAPEQAPAEIAATLQAFFSEHPRATVSEDGKVLFDMRTAKYTVSTEHGRCTLQLWSEDRNLVRRIVAASPRKGVLRLLTYRFGQSKTAQLELTPDPERRTPSARENNRTRYLSTLARVLARYWGDWKNEAFRTAMDLEKSFGPAYARGSLVRGQQAWAVIAVNSGESQTTVDGILTVGVLWLAHLRERADPRRVYRGVRMIVPEGMAALTVSRLAWMNSDAAQWELWELNEQTDEMTLREPGDHGNLRTHLVHAPGQAAARERFSAEIATVMAVIPDSIRPVVELRVRSGGEVAFLLHGLEFARVRSGYTANSFNRVAEITFGAGANETALGPASEDRLRQSLSELAARRRPEGDRRDPLFRMQTERWLESVLREDITRLDPRLNPGHVYTQVPAFAASDRGMLDLLSVLDDGRLAVIELKAEDDLHLALQGLDYWVRVRWHHAQTGGSMTGVTSGLGEFQRHGYFAGLTLSDRPPKLYLVAPALRIHPATEVVLRHLSPRVDWELVALDERWREQVSSVWRKRPADLLDGTRLRRQDASHAGRV